MKRGVKEDDEGCVCVCVCVIVCVCVCVCVIVYVSNGGGHLRERVSNGESIIQSTCVFECDRKHIIVNSLLHHDLP